MIIKREGRERSRSQRATPEHTMSKTQDAAIRAVHARFIKIVSGERPIQRAPNVSTRSLYLSDASNTLSKHDGKTGSALGSLYAWGFLEKINTHAPQCAIRPKGWAYLIAVGAATIDDVPVPQVEQVNQLLPAMTEQYGGRPVQDLDAFVAGDDDGPTAEEVEALLIKRLEDPEQTTLALSALIKAWPDIDAKSISDNLTPLEILKADLATTQKGPDNYWKRELGVRLSTRYEGDLYSTDHHGPKVGAPGSLAEHLSPASVIEHQGLHGKDRIAAGLQMHEDQQAGIARNMPPSATLGEVWERRDRESAMGAMSELHDDYLPISDWIEAEMDAAESNQDSEPFILLKDAKRIARGAVLRSVRERVSRDPLRLPDDLMSHRHSWRGMLEECLAKAPEPVTGEQDDRSYYQHELDVFDRVWAELDAMLASGDIPPDTRRPMNAMDGAHEAVGYNGFQLQIKRAIKFEDRNASVLLTVDSDYDPDDTENVRAWFEKFIQRGLLKDQPGRTYNFPPNSDAELERVGDLEVLKVRGGINLVWAGVIGMLGGIAGTGALMLVLSFFIR